LCLLVIGGVGYWIVYPQIRAEYYWRRAQKALYNYDLVKAQEHLERCVEARPTDGEVLFAMARTLRRQGNLEGAATYLRRAKQQNWVPDQIKLENLLIKAQTGYLSEISNQLQAILKEGHIDDRFILEALVFGYFRTNFLTEANRWATVWIDQHPDDWLARYWHGAVLEGGSQFSLAKEEYEKALELNPDGLDLHFRLAEVLMHNKASRETMAHYEAALKVDPGNAKAMHGLARCQHSLQSSEVARATLLRLIELHPEFVGAYTLLAQLADEEDRPEEALEWLQKAQKIDPNDHLMYQRLVEVLRRLNRDAEAQQVLQRSKEIDQQLSRLDEIVKDVLNQPKDVALRNEAGNILLKLEKPQEAFRWFISAFFIDSKYQPTRDGMKKCLQRMGDKELTDRYKQLLDEPSK
jgi:tetratricopeptide (TPR) repeat protein